MQRVKYICTYRIEEGHWAGVSVLKRNLDDLGVITKGKGAQKKP